VLLLMELLFHGETMISADELFDYRLFDRRQIVKTMALQRGGITVTPLLATNAASMPREHLGQGFLKRSRVLDPGFPK
jgi:hypothetical protein